MTDKEFKDFISKFEAYLQFREENLVSKDEFREAYSELNIKLDHILDIIDTEESERLAGNTTTDRTLDNHERRIRKLELA